MKLCHVLLIYSLLPCISLRYNNATPRKNQQWSAEISLTESYLDFSKYQLSAQFF